MQQSFRKSLSPRRTGTLSPRASPRRLKPLQEENIVGHIRALQKDAGDSADAYLVALAAQERASDALAASYRMRAAPASPRGRGGSQLSSAAGSDAGYGGAQAAQKPALSARPQLDKDTKGFIQQASNAMNSRFSDMFKAFQYVDLDKSGSLDAKEIRRALDMWNVPMDEEKLQKLVAACDHDGDGQVDYKEFVDMLARDTVAPAAMGKRDMQSLEAMGVDAQEMLNLQLGHGKEKAYKISINDGMDDTAFAVQMSDEDRLKQASNAMNSRFTDMFKAFQYVDLDGSGTVDEKELLHALDLWNVPIDKASVKKLIAKCDHDGDGGIDYKEFVDHLARDTVAPAAMGKRDMQSKQAMGVDAQEMLNLQLGHGKEKSYKISIND
jgi:Ca2+-binding EF-hand superfamily protein